MPLKSVMALVAGLTLAIGLAPDAGEARGGGAHYVYVPVFIPGRSGRVEPFTPNPGVDLPLELTDAPVDSVEGVVGLHQAIARHQVRAADAIVVDQPVPGGRRAIPAGSVLAKVFLTEGGRTTQLWCDMRTFDGMGSSRFDCFGDLDGSGKLNGQWTSLTSDEFLGFGGDENIKFKRRMDAPVAFHPARPEERPTGQIGYEWCGGDGAAQTPRFEVSASFSGGYWEESETHACPFGQWVDAAKTILAVDAIRIEVKPGPKPNTLAFKVDGRIAPGAIAHLEPGGPIRPRAAAAVDAAFDQSALTEQALIPTGAPARIASGGVTEGETLFSMGVKHGITGVLTSGVWLGKYYYFHQGAPPTEPALKAGQIVYARSMANAEGMQIAWCAPRKSDAGAWADAVCLPKDGTGYVWIEAQPALLAGDLTMPASLRPYATPPIVTRQAVDLPAMTLSYSFEGWSKAGASIEARINWGDGERKFRSMTLKPGLDGAATLAVQGGQLLLQPGATPSDAVVTFKATEGAKSGP